VAEDEKIRYIGELTRTYVLQLFQQFW